MYLLPCHGEIKDYHIRSAKNYRTT